MEKITEITNREEIVVKLAELLMQFDKKLNGYQTDVYLYIDEETGAAMLDTFVNVGGNSWLDDDGIVIYTDKQHYDSLYDFCTEKSEFADCIGIDYDQLKHDVVQGLVDRDEIDGDEAGSYEPDYQEFLDYVQSREDYVEALETSYFDWIDDNLSDYLTRAEEIVKANEERENEEENFTG